MAKKTHNRDESAIKDLGGKFTLAQVVAMREVGQLGCCDRCYTFFVNYASDRKSVLPLTSKHCANC